MFGAIDIKTVKESVGTLVRQVRAQREMTQQELAERLAVSRNTVVNLEAGKNFTIDTLFKALRELDLLEDVYQQIQQANDDLSNTKSLY